MSVVLNPATEEPLAELESAGVEETDAAVARAKAAYPAWRAVAPADRARLLRRLATLVEEHHEELSRIEARAARSRWSRRSSTSTRARSTSTTARRFRSAAAST
jgi:acyl-CoA reductase-like NAD-dependent aldehyde dehydrogenase